MTSRSDQSGFTLIELLIVLAIMASANVLFATYVRTGTRGAELRAATREMAAALDETRSFAMARNQIAALVLAAGAHAYSDPRRSHQVASRVRVTYQGMAPLPADRGAGAIYFFPDGSSSGGEIDFAIDAASEAVSVDWFTGEVSAHGIRAARR